MTNQWVSRVSALALAVAVVVLAALWASRSQASSMDQAKVSEGAVSAGSQSLVLGGGCFWCIEALFEDLKGVLKVESGYAGGDRPGVTYEQVCSGKTGHAEVIQVTFDPKQISAADLLRLFFVAHDPTTLNRQGPDVGIQYRSVIFYANESERRLAEEIKAEMEAQKVWPRPIVTTIEPLRNYTRAEEYHQDYFAKFEAAGPAQKLGMNAGYCMAIIEPKVREFRAKFRDRLKR